LSVDTGRFYGADTFDGLLQDPRTRQNFMYGTNNPTNLIDPTGRFSLIEAIATVTIAGIVLLAGPSTVHASQSEGINWQQDQPGPKALWEIVHENYPQAKNLGIYVPRNVAGTKKPSGHAEGRALDIGLLASDPIQKAIGDNLFRTIIFDEGELGLDHVIWNRQIWSRQHPSILPFTGNYPNGGPRNPHIDHIHVEFTREGSQRTRFPYFEFLIELGSDSFFVA